MKLKLYLIVGTYTEYDGDDLITEWVLVARDNYPSYDESVKILEDHIHEATDTEREDFDIVDCWTNHYEEVDGHKIEIQ